MLKKISLFFLISFFVHATHPCILKEEFVFTSPPFASCHASTLTQADSEALLCAWFAGTAEGASDVEIWLASLIGDAWEKPRKITAENTACWNPVLFTLPSKEILLFYKVGGNPQQWSGLLKRSFDEGKRWTEAENLPAGVIGPTKNSPLLLSDGITLLCGSSVESWMRWGCWIDITKDDGRSWNKSSPINVDGQLFGIIQPALFFTKQGTVKLLARSHQIGSICSAESHDAGKTWEAAQPISLPNPNSAIDAINLTDGRILLVYNHSQEHRCPLNVALSNDDGQTWEMTLTLEKLPGEYSYPSTLQAKDGKIHITYTWNRTRIKHVVLDPKLMK
jgi:predicted neuraminidase